MIRFLRFSIAGALNTAIGLGVIVVCTMSGLNPYLANFAGYAVGFSLSFALNRRLTFGRRGPISYDELSRFAVAVFSAFTLNLIVLYLAKRIFAEHDLVAQLLAVMAYAACFYLLASRYVFGTKDDE